MIKNVSYIIKNYTRALYRRWTKYNRTLNKFLKLESSWLKEEIVIPVQERTPEAGPSGSRKRGRPTKDFEESSSKSKKRKIVRLMQSHATPELSLAARLRLRSSGKRQASMLLKEATETTPTRAYKIRRAYASSSLEQNKFSPEQALALMIDLDLSRDSYNLLRQKTKEIGVNIHPAYTKIREAKEECYPPKEDIILNETSGEVVLQGLVDITVNRLIKAQEEIVKYHVNNICTENIEMIYKWGVDGSSGQKEYKQKITEGSSQENTSDSNLMLSSLVPIQLYGYEKNSSNKKVIWQNPRPSSTRYCRPIKFEFKKETKETIKQEYEYINNQIKNLQPTKININGEEIVINHKLILTMIDGKVCSALTDTSSQVCYICGVSPKDINNLEAVKKRPCDISTYSFGLSTLHAHIRFFECMLHISYRLEVKKWQMRTQEDKNLFAARRTVIIDRFRKETGMLVDQIKQGTGSTNDGNTARRFFANPEISSAITGIDEKLIHRLSVILQVISSGHDINVDNFRKYCYETADLYVQLYNWYKMPSSVHKILLHGPDVVKHFLLPIGQFSEEAQEARNKDYRRFREDHTRKFSRVKANEDLIHLLLITSDPFITSIRSVPKKPVIPLLPDALTLVQSLYDDETDDADAESD